MLGLLEFDCIFRVNPFNSEDDIFKCSFDELCGDSSYPHVQCLNLNKKGFSETNQQHNIHIQTVSWKQCIALNTVAYPDGRLFHLPLPFLQIAHFLKAVFFAVRSAFFLFSHLELENVYGGETVSGYLQL